MNKLSKKTRQLMDQKGSFLGAVLLIVIVITAFGITLTQVITTQYSHTKRSTFVADASLVAEAGIEQSLAQLNSNNSFAGYATEQTFFNSTNQGKGTYSSTIVDAPTGSSKIITATGKVYRTSTSTTPISTRKVRVTIVGTGSDGYSVQTGPGGLILTGSGNITNSDVYVNGTITLSGAAKIGTYNNPLDVKVAFQSCPSGNSPGSTYPTTCTTGEPISLAQSTNIYGTVCATNQTSIGPNKNGNILPGVSGQGLVSGCVAPPVAQPSFDRSAHIAKMTTTGAATDVNYNCSTYKNPGGFVRTWPANLKLTGNVSASSSCDLTISGDVYITGDLTIGGAAKIKVADSVGTTRPVILVDGKITVGGSGGIIANTSGTGAWFVSTKSNAPCGSACTNITGTQLKSTQTYETINVSGAASLAGMVFQAYWGQVTIGGSGNIGAAVGQTVNMSGAGTVTFGTKLSSGNTIWTVTSYQQLY